MTSTTKRRRKKERRKRNAERRAAAIADLSFVAPPRRQVSLQGRGEQKVEFIFGGDTIPVDPERPVESLSERAEAIKAWERDGNPTSGTA